jgi:hypothetical protein
MEARTSRPFLVGALNEVPWDRLRRTCEATWKRCESEHLAPSGYDGRKEIEALFYFIICHPNALCRQPDPAHRRQAAAVIYIVVTPAAKVVPRYPTEIAFRSPVGGNPQRQQRELPPGSFALLSHRLGCGACTRSHDTRPKQERLGSSSMSVPHTQERALHRRELGGLSPLQTMYQLPSPQQRQRLPHHSQQSQFGAHM